MIDSNQNQDYRALYLDNTLSNFEISREQTFNTAQSGYLLSGQNARDNMAQSQIKPPLGVPVFWETRARPPTKWSTSFGILNMAIMARDNLQVDKNPKLKTTRAE